MQIWGRRKSGSDTELKFYGNIVSVYEQGKYEKHKNVKHLSYEKDI